MIKFKLGKLLEKQGKSMYWLSKESGVRPNTISQWASEDKIVKSINTETLDSICKTLKCDISDIIEYVNDQDGE